MKVLGRACFWLVLPMFALGGCGNQVAGELQVDSAGALTQDALVMEGLNLAPAAGELYDDSVIVRFKDRGKAAEKLAAMGHAPKAFLLSGSALVPGRGNAMSLAKSLAARADVQFAEPNYKVSMLAVPNDPFFSPYQWHLSHVKMPEAHDITKGAGVIVAVVDTGVNTAGSDTPLNVIQGYDFINNDADATDDNSHGTHVAGTIAQATNNGVAVAGMAPDVTILAVKVLDASGSGSITSVANGIIFAADHGAKVINMSLGASAGSAELAAAVAYAYNKGVTIAAASGNDGSGTIGFPAAYPECLAVGATRFDNALAPYSQYGAEQFIVAPGGDTAVDQNGDTYPDGVLQETFQTKRVKGKYVTTWGFYFFQGTSMATPHVAGAAALLIAAGASSPAQVKQLLADSATDLGAAGWDSTFGYGLLNIKAALDLL